MTSQLKRPLVWMHLTTEEDRTDGMSENFIRMAREHFDIVWYKELKENPEMGKEITGAIAAFAGKKYFKEQRALMPNLKVVANFGAGYDGLDVRGLSVEGVQVSNTPDVLSDCVADLAIMLMIASARLLKPGMKIIEDGVQTFDKHFLGVQVSGATLGIVGMGSIGKCIAKRARAFDMDILYHQRNERKEGSDGAKYYGSLHDMLPLCDFLILACPLSDATRNLISTREFHLMKTTATIVNIARGAVIDHQALVEALSSGEIRGAALDVTEPEPLPSGHALLNMDSVLILPHLGSATLQTREEMFRTCVENLKAGLIDKRPLPNLVTPN